MGSVRFPSLAGRALSRPYNELWLGWVMALTATLGFSIAPPISRAAILQGMDPTTLVMARMIGTTFLLGLTIALTRPARLRLGWRVALFTIGAGMINGIGFLAFFWALGRLESSIASMLFSINPLVVLGLLALRGERLTRRHAVRLALGLGGVYLLIGPGGQVDLIGALLVFLTILSFSLHLVIVQWSLKDYDAWAITFYVIVGITCVVFAGWLLQGAHWENPGQQGWLAIVALILVSTYLARLALFAGVRQLGSGQIAFMSPLETLLTVIWSLMFLNERLSFIQFLGGLAILASVLLASRRLRWIRGRPRLRLWPKP